MKHLERALIARLRSMTLEEAEFLPDSGDGLAARLLFAARQTSNLEELYALTKTRAYAHARVRRLALYALLGLREQDRPAAPPYIRVLGMNATGAKVLSMAKGQTALPLSHSLARLERLGGRAEAFTALEARAADLYGLLCPAVPPCGMDYTNSIITL